MHLLKITSREDFDKIFGMAAVMGKDSMPTNIDFARQYVIAVICKTTNHSAALDVSDLVKSNDSIMVNYKYTEGEKTSYSSRPFKILIVDSQDQGELKLQKI